MSAGTAPDIVTDVLVVGFGGAGAAAAVEAHDRGADVLIVEKMPEGGGSTRESAGSIGSVARRDAAIEHYLALTKGRTPRALVETFVDGLGELDGWFRANGSELVSFAMWEPIFPHRKQGSAYPNLPGSDGIGLRLRVPAEAGEQGGESLWAFLSRNVDRRGIPVLTGAPAHRLLIDADGTVYGVEVRHEGRARRVIARRGVCLTCGGYNYGGELLRDAVGVHLPALSPPGRNTGDGIRMAQAAGADLWHMNCVVSTFGYKFDGEDAAFLALMPAYGFFVVDQAGRRFVDETAVENHAAAQVLLVPDTRTGDLPRLPSVIVFDERTRLAGRVALLEIGENRRYPWSADNSAEIAKGWIRRAGTIEELAGQAGLPADTLVETARRYNAAAACGGDDHARPVSRMAALETPPYYAIPVWPALFNTQGGPRRDERARILRPDGSPIPRLFSAGELGSMWATLYPGAGNVSEGIVYGRIAGRNAAAQPPYPRPA
ncbi:FAD-binding protein [Phytohabitans sp. ZYX-F-186]|uniref:FAD-binding protein n=1 Tax=Phytohabitans maris TaxID=3071409 RepID=A0ABU0ZSB9_9ACTN|nr:FAD-binding protein [Phytohabitans sp. ZYX-F-186]MDQ7909931.1 FAD-binding protein [Phytohabitans sp. ZYX-F-186]